MSSNSSAAFVPVSAVPGGVPPGTPLYGAYGQPLPPSAPGPQPRGYQYPPSEYTPPMQSPTGAYAPYDDKDPGRRRARPLEEEHSSRPPPPNYPLDDDPRRRSPISVNSNGTPPAGYAQYQQSPYDRDRPPTPIQNSPPRPIAQQPPSRPPQVALTQAPPQQPQPPSQFPPQPRPQPSPASSGYAQPPSASYAPPPPSTAGYAQPPSTSYSNPMSLDNLMGPGPRNVNDIDRSMLGKLDRRS